MPAHSSQPIAVTSAAAPAWVTACSDPAPRLLRPTGGRAAADVLGRGGADAPGLTVCWLGQAGFALAHAGHVLLIDPYLSDSLATKYAGTVFPHRRLHPPPVQAAALRSVRAVAHTHAHTDHLDPDTIRALLRHNRPRFVAPRAKADIALQRHIPTDALSPVTAGDVVHAGPFTLTVVPAAHEQLQQDPDGAHHFLGYVVDVAGLRLYHSGDCVPYPGQVEMIARLAPDVALLPINGRDGYRLANGVPGNFTLAEAVELCHRAAIPELVCHHIGLFDFNTVDPRHAAETLRATAGSLLWTVPAPGAVLQSPSRPVAGQAPAAEGH